LEGGGRGLESNLIGFFQFFDVGLQLFGVVDSSFEDFHFGGLILAGGGDRQEFVEFRQLGIEPLLPSSLGGVVEDLVLPFPLQCLVPTCERICALLCPRKGVVGE